MNRSESLSDDLIGDFFEKVIQILVVIGGAIVGLVVVGTIVGLFLVVRAVFRFVLIVLIVVGAVIGFILIVGAIIRFVIIRAEIEVIEIEVIKIYVIVDLSEFEIVLAFLRGTIVGFVII